MGRPQRRITSLSFAQVKGYRGDLAAVPLAGRGSDATVGEAICRRLSSLLADAAVDRLTEKVGVADVTGRLLDQMQHDPGQREATPVAQGPH
jgi:hypothetical protein